MRSRLFRRNHNILPVLPNTYRCNILLNGREWTELDIQAETPEAARKAAIASFNRNPHVWTVSVMSAKLV